MRVRANISTAICVTSGMDRSSEKPVGAYIVLENLPLSRLAASSDTWRRMPPSAGRTTCATRVGDEMVGIGLARHLNGVKHIVHNAVCRESFNFGVWPDHQAMPQHRPGHGLYIVRRNKIPPTDCCQCSGCQQQ